MTLTGRARQRMRRRLAPAIDIGGEAKLMAGNQRSPARVREQSSPVRSTIISYDRSEPACFGAKITKNRHSQNPKPCWSWTAPIHVETHLRPYKLEKSRLHDFCNNGASRWDQLSKSLLVYRAASQAGGFNRVSFCYHHFQTLLKSASWTKIKNNHIDSILSIVFTFVRAKC